MSTPRFSELLQQVLNGDRDDISAIESAINEDETLLAEYLDQVELDALLSWELGDEVVEMDETVAAEKVIWWRFASGPLAKVAAVILLLGVGFFLGRQRSNDNSAIVSSAPVAVLIDSEDCEWESGEMPHSFGASFAAGETLRINSGIARFALWSKAGVAIVGPAEIELVSSEEVSVRYGSVSAFAPDEAIGFKLTTPDVEIVDLGTRFAASVRQDGTTDVHVFEGEVSVQSRKNHPSGELVTTGQARRYHSGGDQRTEIAIAPEQFEEPPELEQLLAFTASRNGASGLETRAEMASEPGVIAAHRFVGAGGELDGQYGGTGFAAQPWWASPDFTRVIPLVKSHSGGARAGGYLLVRGRDKAEPFVANRLSRRLAGELPNTFFFTLRASYHGLDEDDFFSLWIDSNGREDATHANVPTLGIREGRYFARLDVEHAAVAGNPRDGEEFIIVGRYVWNAEDRHEEIALWINPSGADAASPDAVLQRPMAKAPSGKFSYLGLRIGKHTEVSDRLLIHSFAVGTKFPSALAAVEP